MEKVEIEQILNERNIDYARFQILDYRSNSLKSEINKRCRDLFTIDKLISYNHTSSHQSLKSNSEIENNQPKENLPHIYCSSLGIKNGIVDPKLQSELYSSILKCIKEGIVSNHINILKITDHSHPVRLATPINQSCYTLIWSGEDLSEFHNTPVILGEYTGNVKYVGDEDICDESYSFQLTFKSSAFRYSGSVISCNNFQISDETHNSVPIQSISQNTYYPDNYEYVESKENSNFLINKSNFYSKVHREKFNEFQSTEGSIRKIGARLLLPNDNEYVVSADKVCNEMAFLNHYECVLNNCFNLRINVQWHSIYVDGWPHIILTTIPGIGIKLGDELAADFGENWFSRIKNISEINIKNELISFRLKYGNIAIENKFKDMSVSKNMVNLDKDFKIADRKILTENNISGLIHKYDVCEICQTLIPFKKDIYRISSKTNNNFYKSLKNSYLLCNGCNRAFHWYCVNRPEFLELNSSSVVWFCFQCISLSLRILPSLLHKIPFINQKNFNLIRDLYNDYETLISGLINTTGEVILRSSDETYMEGEKIILFRPSEYNNNNQRFFSEYSGLEGLSRLKPCYLCYSSFSISNPLSVGIAIVCRIHRLHMAPDFDEFFNSFQYNNSYSKNNSKNNQLNLSLISENQYNGRKYIDSSKNNSELVLKSHIKKFSGTRYVIERARKIICFLRSSLYQSERHRIELLHKIEKLRCVQDKYFRTISEGNGTIPVFCIKLGDTIINKEFSGKLYQGIVTRYYPNERSFHIEYMDGDREDLEYEDFASLLINDVLTKRIKMEDLLIKTEDEIRFHDESENFDQNNLEIKQINLFNLNQIEHFERIFDSKKSKKDSSVKLINEEAIIDGLIKEKVNFIHNIILQKCNFQNKEHILIKKIPEYRYVDEPTWNVLYGSFFINEGLIYFNIDIVLSRFSFSTITLELISKLVIENIEIKKNIPITIANKNEDTKVKVKSNQCFSETCTSFREVIEYSVNEILYWTQNRLNEFYVINKKNNCNMLYSELVDHCSVKENEVNNFSKFDENIETAIDESLLNENWLQKANMIAQILLPYPDGIEWIEKTHSWKVIYLNEFGQKAFKIFKTIPFDENSTVESLYLRACKFISVSQSNNKIIKMLTSNRKLQDTQIENSIQKFIFNDWSDKTEDFLARYNLNNPDGCLYSLNDLNNEINSLRPFPENLDWCDISYSFVVSLPNGEKNKFHLENYKFNLVNCYISAFNFATGNSNNSENYPFEKKIRKYNSRIKNQSDVLTKKKSNEIFESIVDKSVLKKNKKMIDLKDSEENYHFCLDQSIINEKESNSETYQNKSDINCTSEIENNSTHNILSNDLIKLNSNINNQIKNNFVFSESQEFDQSSDSNYKKLLKRKRTNKKDKPIVRASPTPSDPLSRARIIEYSEKADKLRPFPHGITWCYRSARFKVRYRRPSDGCWTATSFTPTKYNSVEEAFENAIQKLAAHIDDYKNSNEIPIIPQRKL